MCAKSEWFSDASDIPCAALITGPAMRDDARQDHADEPDYGGVIPPRGDDQPRSRNALSDAYCENYWPLQGRRRAGSAASRALDASSANRSARTNCETRQTQCQLLERVIGSPRACSYSCTTGTRRSFTPASRKTSCANATGRVTPMDNGSLRDRKAS